AASVLPEPVGAAISAWPCFAVTGHARACASVGWPKRAANQAATAGWNCCRAACTSRFSHGSGSWDEPAQTPTQRSWERRTMGPLIGSPSWAPHASSPAVWPRASEMHLESIMALTNILASVLAGGGRSARYGEYTVVFMHASAFVTTPMEF